MRKTTEIYLVRHGQSIHNLEERIAGQHDSQLTELGFQDAKVLWLQPLDDLTLT